MHSRSRLAGYDPELLFKSKVLVVGAGAIGQNLALDLALAGVGELDIVDFDTFEPHNATRSPLYPTAEEQVHWGMKKAKTVAHKLLPMMTAPTPKIRYAVAPIQELGDLPFMHVQLVFAAVDNQNARAYLAERCHVVGRPLVEAGIFAEYLNVAVFGPEADDPCYRCQSPEKVGAYSCTLSALEMEAQQMLPAIQNTAAVVAGLQAEIGIQWLHGDQSLKNKRVYANIRSMMMRVVQLVRSPSCPGVHWQNTSFSPVELEVGGDDSLGRLLNVIGREIGFAEIRFPTELVVRNSCARCDCLTDARVPEWRWLVHPLCTQCGGLFNRARKDDQLSSKVGVYTDETEEDIVSLTCSQVGLPSGTLCEIWPEANRVQLGERYLLRLKGSIDELMQEIAMAPEMF